MTRTLLVLILVGAALAGCLGDDGTEPDTDPAPTASPDATPDPPPKEPPAVTVPTDLTVRSPEAVVEGSVDREATVSAVLVDDDETTPVGSEETDGPFTFTFPVPYGQSTLRVTADDGSRTTTVEVEILRTAPGTHAVVFRGPTAPEDREDPFEFDPDSFPSAPLYDGCEVAHPGYHTVHDAMLVWQEATGADVTYSDCGQFGYSVEAIEGYEQPGFWCYARNGSTDVLGISSEPFEPEDQVTWDSCSELGIG